MDDLWLYASIFLLCYIWSFFGLPYTANKKKLYAYPAFFAIVFCFAILGIKSCGESDTGSQTVYRIR